LETIDNKACIGIWEIDRMLTELGLFVAALVQDQARWEFKLVKDKIKDTNAIIKYNPFHTSRHYICG